MAKRKIVISEYDNIAALMEDERAVEFIIHHGDMLLGDVYLATVENILPSIDAAFVNVGGDKMGFLHSSDVPGKGDLKERLEPKQQLVVQIMKEPTGHKGPRVSTNISLPGRFLVMMPESKGISISRKIVESTERSRLKSVVSLIKPPGVGVIIRTEATNQKESDITEDFETLLERWQNIVSMADTSAAPTLLYRDQDLLYRVIREAVTEDVTEIIVDSAFGQQRAQQLLQTWNMDKGVKVTHYQGSQPILVGTGVDKEIKLALQTKVPLPSGGYLYIQPTEALTVVDVNSGKFTSLQSQAETIKLTNLESCKEIARQLRLRNIGGMIVVDFIDMESRANQLQVMQTFENELAPDKSKPQIGQLSDLGLVEMTRHRQGQSLSEIFTRRCTSCSGTGHAIDEFSWMHPGGDGEGRGGRQGGRNKMPMRQGGRNNQVPKPAASPNQRRDKGRVLLNSLDARREAAAQLNAAITVTPGNILLSRLNEKRNAASSVAEQESLVDLFSDGTFKRTGVRLAGAAKLSFMPLQINSILSRINPKANDIVSLVYSIENNPNPMHFTSEEMSDLGDDDSDLDNDSDLDDEDIEAAPVAETPRRERTDNRGDNRNGGRNNRNGSPNAPRNGQAPRPRFDSDEQSLENDDLELTGEASDIPETEETGRPQRPQRRSMPPARETESFEDDAEDAAEEVIERQPARQPQRADRPNHSRTAAVVEADSETDDEFFSVDDAGEDEEMARPVRRPRPMRRDESAPREKERTEAKPEQDEDEVEIVQRQQFDRRPKATPAPVSQLAADEADLEPVELDFDDDDDEDGEFDDAAEPKEGISAAAKASAQAKRRRGRTAKRSIKKPPAKR